MSLSECFVLLRQESEQSEVSSGTYRAITRHLYDSDRMLAEADTIQFKMKENTDDIPTEKIEKPNKDK